MNELRKVFISHASKSFAIADDIRRRLESLGHECWVAPRDIPSGSSYGSEIVAAIESCLLVVIVLTEEANASRAVANELELAFRNQRVIIPVRLKPVEPASSLAFFVNNTQWVDAFHTPLKERVPELARLIEAIRAGSSPPPPLPEKKTLLGKVERQIEGLIRYKLLTAVFVGVLLTLVGGAAALMSGKTVSLLEAAQAKIDTDPATFGHVTLAAASDPVPGAPQPPLRATVYVNLKDPDASEVQWKAFSKRPDSHAVAIDTQPLEAIRTSGAQFLPFDSVGNSIVVVFCMTAKHPNTGSKYTARWDFLIKSSASTTNISRAGAPRLSPTALGDCT